MIFDPIDILLISVLIGFGSFVQAGLGFGLGIVAAPFLVLIDPSLVPSVVLSMVLLVGGLTVFQDRRLVKLGELRWVWVGRLPGTAAGALFIAKAPPAILSVLLGLSVLVAVLLSLKTPTIQRTPSRLTWAGIISGFMAATTAMGGPPVALIYQDRTQGHERPNLAADMALGTVVAIIALVFVDNFGQRDVILSIFLVPAALIGYFLAAQLLPYLSPTILRKALLVLCSIAGVTAVLKGVSDVWF